MSKLDIGVGDEFPLDKDNSERPHRGRHGRHGRRGHRHGHDHAHHHMGHHGHHHRRHHFHGLPLLLIIGGVAALIVAGKLPATAAYAMIGVGLLLLAAMIFFGVRHFRRFHSQGQIS